MVLEALLGGVVALVATAILALVTARAPARGA